MQGAKKSAKYTISRITRKSREECGPNSIPKETMGSGWTSRGIQTYNDLYKMVKKDRVQRGSTFNMDLWRFYSDQEKKKEGIKDKRSCKKTKVVAFNDLNPPDCEDCEEVPV